MTCEITRPCSLGETISTSNICKRNGKMREINMKITLLKMNDWVVLLNIDKVRWSLLDELVILGFHMLIWYCAMKKCFLLA